MTEEVINKKIMLAVQKANEIYDLGVRMQEAFSKSETTKREYMVMAIVALIMEYENKPTVSAPDENFGAWLKDMRTRNKITLRQIEDATGISNSYLSQLETGKIKKPSHDTVLKIIALVTKNETVAFNPLIPGSGLLGL